VYRDPRDIVVSHAYAYCTHYQATVAKVREHIDRTIDRLAYCSTNRRNWNDYVIVSQRTCWTSVRFATRIWCSSR
jgi:hypothetical protein